MHMVDALLSPTVGTVMCAVGVAGNAYALKKIKKEEISEKKIPIMGVMGAFVFVAQMLNVTIPLTGASGHFVGGILLAVMLGEFPATVVTSVVLIIQCLFFADGGLLALGCNIFNMAIIPSLIVYPLLFKPFIKNGVSAAKITILSIISSIVGLSLGAFCVVLETLLSSVTALPFKTFLIFMQPIHFAIGIFEGLITAAVLCFVYRAKPELLESALERKPIKKDVSISRFVIVLAVIILLIGGLGTIYASTHPDGFEWAVGKTISSTSGDEYDPFEEISPLQDSIAVMPDYVFKGTGEEDINSTPVAGIVGGLISFVLACILALVITVIKRKRKDSISI